MMAAAGGFNSGTQQQQLQEGQFNRRQIARMESDNLSLRIRNSDDQKQNRSPLPDREAPLQTLPNNQIMDTEECENVQDSKKQAANNTFQHDDDDQEDIEDELRKKHGDKYTSPTKKMRPSATAKKASASNNALDDEDNNQAKSKTAKK